MGIGMDRDADRGISGAIRGVATMVGLWGTESCLGTLGFRCDELVK